MSASQSLGDVLSDFNLPAVDGASRSLRSSIAGSRAAVVIFWSGICSHCRRYDGYLNHFAQRYPTVALLAVAARQDESLEQLRAAVQERGLRFPLLHDADRQVARRWLVEQTPRVFLLDPERRLLYRGAIDNFKYPEDAEHAPYLDAALADVLAGRAPARPETPSFGCPIESVYYQLPKPLRRGAR